MANSVHFSPVVTQKASEAIFDQIRDMILDGQLKPGDKLPGERKMMEMLQRSRPTIREALRMLENAGLIRSVPGGGAIIREPATESIQQPLENLLVLQSVSNEELLEYRSYNEMMIAVWAAERRTEQDLADIREVVAMATDPALDHSEFFALDIKFHALVAKASHNRLAAIMERVVYGIVNRRLEEATNSNSEAELEKMRSSILDGHSRILSAIEKQDAGEIRLAMQDHLDSFAGDILLATERPERAETGD